jgi:hypothetical protein
MTTKVCTQCIFEKELEYFPNCKSGKYNKLAKCKDCDKINQKNRYLKNKQYRIQKSKEYKLKNKEHNSKIDHKRYLNQRKIKLAYQKQQRINNPEYIKQYRIKNKEKIRQTSNDWQKNKYYTDTSYRLRNVLQKRIIAAIKGNYKSASTVELLGCSIEQFKLYLEAQFWKDERVDWITYGPKGWHLDHIRPCASFDLSDPTQQKKCFHYTNLQPLWWDENIAKADKILV